MEKLNFSEDESFASWEEFDCRMSEWVTVIDIKDDEIEVVKPTPIAEDDDEDEFYTNEQGMVCRVLSDDDWDAIMAKEKRKNDIYDYNHQGMSDEEIAEEERLEQKRWNEYMNEDE